MIRINILKFKIIKIYIKYIFNNILNFLYYFLLIKNFFIIKSKLI